MKSPPQLHSISLSRTTARRSLPLCRLKIAILLLFGLVVIAGTLGCTQVGERAPQAAPEVPYVDGNEVARLVQSSSEPMLLEFCVPVGCFRCDEMRPSINALAKEKADSLSVLRVNLNFDRELAAEWGVTVCPTYVVIAEGREVGRTAYPTSADLVSAMIPLPSEMD